MAYTQEQLSEITLIVSQMAALTGIIHQEELIPLADRLIDAGNITKINNNIGEFSDYLATLVPPA